MQIYLLMRILISFGQLSGFGYVSMVKDLSDLTSLSLHGSFPDLFY